MPTGLIVYNDHGTVLIDDANANMMFVGRGQSTVVFTSPQGQNTWRWSMGTGFVHANAMAPQVAFRSNQYVSGVKPRIDNVNFNPARILGRAEADIFTTGAVVDWAVIDKPVSPSTDNVGLQVLNASGQVMFDSRLKYPSIFGVITPTVVGTEYAYSLGANREYMFLTGSYALCKMIGGIAYVKVLSASELNKPVLIIDVTNM